MHVITIADTARVLSEIKALEAQGAILCVMSNAERCIFVPLGTKTNICPQCQIMLLKKVKGAYACMNCGFVLK